MVIGRGEFLAGMGHAAVAAAVSPSLPIYAATVAIGVVCPLSGEFRKAGEQLADGVRAAIDDQNQLRAGFDKLFTLRTFDDHNSVADAIVNAQFAIDDATIVAVIGHLGAKSTLSTLRTYATAQMPLFVPAATLDAITEQGYHNVFRLPTKDSTEGRLLGRFVIDKYAPKAPHAVVNTGDYGADVVTGYLQAYGAKATLTVTQIPFDKPDFAAAAQEIVAAKPDHVLVAGTAQELGPVVKALRDKGYSGPLAAPQGFFDALTATTYAKECDGMIVSTSMPYLAIAPTAYRAVNSFRAQYGAFAPVSAFSYAAAQIIFAAVSRSGVTQRNALSTSMTLGGGYSTLVGSFTFAPTGDPIDPEVYFYTIADGKFAYIRQAHPSAFLPR